ncbi:MAG: hypothetical protein IT453_01420, partial [Planctomycetes bacterium]|nr:hypothetical protein [Planctomycetota bacterium]
MRRHALALALLVAFALVLLAEPIVRHATHTYTSADLTQDFALTRVGDGTLVANRGLYDPPTEMQPWLAFAREELAAGRLPLWNPYNAAGVPLHANYQSAIFSPLSVPYYLFEFKTAAILSALLRLVLLGWFTYLFVRALAFDVAPALVAATAFMLSGKSVLLLAYPHSAVAVALPAAAWCIERAVQSLERGEPRKRTAAWFAGLCGAFTFGVYAGHPEPLVFVALLALAWAAWRALALARRLGWRAGAGVLGGVGAAGAVALLLGAPQILPFAEYFANSAAFGTREPTVQPSLLDWWPLLVYP